MRFSAPVVLSVASFVLGATAQFGSQSYNYGGLYARSAEPEYETELYARDFDDYLESAELHARAAEAEAEYTDEELLHALVARDLYANDDFEELAKREALLGGLVKGIKSGVSKIRNKMKGKKMDGAGVAVDAAGVGMQGAQMMQGQ